jgi:hypothetical protein
MAIASSKIDVWFGDALLPNTPNRGGEAAQKVLTAARSLAEAILENTPPSADQSAAVRNCREAVLWSFQAIQND